MNERIRKLYDIAIQATMVYHDENPRTKQKELDNFCASKFAELIIREAADVATINAHQWHSPGRFILTHFGVEE
jgi:hypothetical protein